MTIHLKVRKIVLSQSIFDIKNQLFFYQKKSFKNINLGDHFFLNSIFEPLYSLKLRPIFDKLTFLGFLLGQAIGQYGTFAHLFLLLYIAL